MLGCNCGHWDYNTTSVAYSLATCLNSGIVWASDGTVEPEKKYHIFSHNTVYYMSQNDWRFQEFCRLKRTEGRDNYGWMAYTKIKEKATYFEITKLTSTVIYNLYKNNTYKNYK